MGLSGEERVGNVAVSHATHGSVIELRSDHLLTISAAKKNVHQSWTLATLSRSGRAVAPRRQPVGREKRAEEGLRDREAPPFVSQVFITTAGTGVQPAARGAAVAPPVFRRS